MKISFKKTKENRCYEDFVNDPLDRGKRRKFERMYSQQIAESAIKLHQRLVSFGSAGEYNKMYGSTDNRIEKKQGTRSNAPMVFKVRVTGSYRKFFHHEQDEIGNLLLTKDWSGDFSLLTSLYVICVNNHDYNEV